MKSSRMTGCATNAWFVRCLFLLISLTLLMALMPSAHAAELPEVCYPTSVQCSEDKTELKKIYDLTPEADPKGIARSDFERDGYHYTLVELLRQETLKNIENHIDQIVRLSQSVGLSEQEVLDMVKFAMED